MLRFYADKFVLIAQRLGYISHIVKTYPKEVRYPPPPIEEDLIWLLKRLNELNLQLSVMTVGRILDYIKDDKISFERLDNLIDELNQRIVDELKIRLIFIIPSNKETFYYPKIPLFGNEVSEKFADMNEDIYEAGNCFAVGRYTACIFHLMRIMEKAVQKLGKSLGILLVDEKEWYAILTSVKAEINKMPKGSKKIVYSAIHDRLDSVRIAWRNETMHPKATYTEEEADSLLGAVKVFIKELLKIL